MKMSGLKTVLDAGNDMDNKDICPICGSEIVEKIIDYSDWNNGYLLITREVPVRECVANGHRFFPAKVARSIAE